MEVVEAPFIRVPFEALKRAAKERKYIVEEVEKVMGEIKKHAGPADGGAVKKEEGEGAAIDRVEERRWRVREGERRRVAR